VNQIHVRVPRLAVLISTLHSNASAPPASQVDDRSGHGNTTALNYCQTYNSNSMSSSTSNRK